MKKLLLGLCLLGLYSSSVYAGEVKLSWGRFDNFVDVVPSTESKGAFHARIQKEFGLVFNQLAKKIPDGYVLAIDVIELDLAGEIRPGMSESPFQNRVMRDITWPCLNFDFKLTNEKKELVAFGSEKLRDMDYLNRTRIPLGQTSFIYEEKMIQDWFKMQFALGKFPSKEGVVVALK